MTFGLEQKYSTKNFSLVKVKAIQIKINRLFSDFVIYLEVSLHMINFKFSFKKMRSIIN